MNQQKLSVIIPVYKGGKFLYQLMKELDEFKFFLEQIDCGLILQEVVFVDDCCVDNSSEILESFKTQYSWIKLIKMSINSGQHAATVEGMRNSFSDWLVTMDEDLQHRPKDIMILWSHRNNNGAELVYALPSGPVHRSKIRNQSSKLIKKFISKLISKKEVVYFNSFRMIKSELALCIVDEFEKKDYLDMLLIKHTKNVSAVHLDLLDIRSLENNESSYNFFKLFEHTKKLVFNLTYFRSVEQKI
jgi:glycosyltransferase involved in cell wall biosynthesis